MVRQGGSPRLHNHETSGRRPQRMKDDIKFSRRRVDTLYPRGERSRLLLTLRTKLDGDLALLYHGFPSRATNKYPRNRGLKVDRR